MRDEKRTFEAETPGMPSLQSKRRPPVPAEGLPEYAPVRRGSKKRQPFTRQTIERLIEWLKEY